MTNTKKFLSTEDTTISLITKRDSKQGTLFSEVSCQALVSNTVQLADRFYNAPAEAIPTRKCKSAHTILSLLADGEQHSRDELTNLLGESWRSGLQQLRGDYFNFWLIHSVKQDNSSITLLQLDPRHLSSDPEQDKSARLERRMQLKKDSYKDARLGWKRLSKAYAAMLEADKAYLISLGEAANESEK